MTATDTFDALLAAVARSPGEECPLLMLADHCEETAGREHLAAGFRAVAKLGLFLTKDGPLCWFNARQYDSGPTRGDMPEEWFLALKGWRNKQARKYRTNPRLKWRDYQTAAKAYVAAAEAFARLSAAGRAMVLGETGGA